MRKFILQERPSPSPILLVPRNSWGLSLIACEQALRGDLVAEREKESELANTSLEFEFHLHFPSDSPSTELSGFANQREAETSANVNKH